MTVTETAAPSGAHGGHAAEHVHPSPAKYVGIALLLAVITGIEVGLYYIDLADNLMIGVLLFLSAIKFALVAAFFMHLRFDGRIVRLVFAGCIVLAIAVYSVVLFSFHVFTT